MKLTSEQIYQKALKYLPGGVSRNTIYRAPYPFYVKKAKGCYITDIEGNKRIDFANNIASLIHGHAYPPILRAVKKQMSKGTAYTQGTEIEVKYAEYLCNRVESFEQIRFVNSGTEAIMAVIKAARAFTGRPMIAKAEGAYHGIYDFAEISEFSTPQNWGDYSHPNAVAPVAGTPQGVLDNVIIFPYNDLQTTLSILDKYADKIACVLIDPVPHRVGFIPGKEDFIEGIYNWTRKNGALLAFDEVVTFRVNYRGAQQNYKVKPDLTALGKAIGGGFPVGAIAGRADVMSVFDLRKTPLLFPHSGTFSANPITLTAGYVAMTHFDEEAVMKLNTLCFYAKEQINKVIYDQKVPAVVTGAGSLFRIHLREKAPEHYRQAYQSPEVKAVVNEILDYLLLKENILMINTLSAAVSTVTTKKEIDRLVEALSNAFKIYKNKIIDIQKYYIS